jgi:DNA-binding PadR family transcriptional regulator
MSEHGAPVPLRPVFFEILLILNAEPTHGYGIMKSLAARPAGRWILGPGTLYRTLAEMRRLGLIEPVVADGPVNRRRSYQLTLAGRKVAGAEARRMETLVAQARAGSLLEGH